MMLVCWWWWFDWSFAQLIAPVVTTTSIILCFNKHRLTQVHLEDTWRTAVETERDVSRDHVNLLDFLLSTRHLPHHHHHIIISSLLLYSKFLTSFLCVSIPLCPQLPVWVQHKPSSFAKSCSIWIILLPLVGLPLILPPIISCKSQSCLKTWQIDGCFLCQIEFSIYLSSFTLLTIS